jgi:hypothetical protein
MLFWVERTHMKTITSIPFSEKISKEANRPTHTVIDPFLLSSPAVSFFVAPAGLIGSVGRI